MPELKPSEIIRAISSMLQKSEAPEELKVDFSCASTMDQAMSRIHSISHSIYKDAPLPIKKARLSHLQFVLAGVEGFAAEHGIATEEEGS